MRHALLALIPVILAACTLTGPTTLGDSATPGQSGKVNFSYQSDRCISGCAIDKPVAEGAGLSVHVEGLESGGHYSMQIVPATLATLSLTDASLPCSGANCSVFVEIQTLASGVATLQILDTTGNVFDSIPITITKADRLEATVTLGGNTATPVSDGSYLAGPGEKIEITSNVYAGSTPLIFSDHAFIPSYSNSAIVASDTSVGFGSSNTESAFAAGPGAATVTVNAHGPSAVVRFTVVK